MSIQSTTFNVKRRKILYLRWEMDIFSGDGLWGLGWVMDWEGCLEGADGLGSAGCLGRLRYAVDWVLWGAWGAWGGWIRWIKCWGYLGVGVGCVMDWGLRGAWGE